MNETDEILASARFRACQAQDYCTEAIYRLRFVESDAVPTFAVDEGWRCFYNPKFLMALKEIATKNGGNVYQLVAGVILHEVWHPLKGHFARMLDEPDKLAANIAKDAEINDDLPLYNGRNTEHLSAVLPPDAVTPKSLGCPDGRLAEEYLDKAKQQTPKNPGVTSGNCGSIASGQPGTGEQAAKAAAKQKGDLPEGMSSAEAHAVRVGVAEAIRAKASGQTYGNIPAEHLRWAEEVLGPPVVPWQKIVSGAVRRAVAHVAGIDDFTYSRPSRRQGSAGAIILPGTHSPVPRIAVVVDTSGSVSERGLGKALREINGVFKAAGVDSLTILAVDAASAPAKDAFNVKAVKKLLRGGGGTNMGVGLDAAAKLKPRPSLTVVLTDAETPWPKDKPNCGQVVVVAIDASAHWIGQVPSWAKVAAVDGEALKS